MATYRQAADPNCVRKGAPHRSALSYLAIGAAAGVMGTTLAIATGTLDGDPIFGTTYAQASQVERATP